MTPASLKFAEQECLIHERMDHDNIVKLYDHTETESEHIMYMEYCDKANYLADKILEVIPFSHLLSLFIAPYSNQKLG